VLPLLIITGVVLAVLITTGRRLLSFKGASSLAWLALIASAAAPVAMGRLVLNPGEAYDTQVVYGEKDVVELVSPEPGKALMVTATLNDMLGEDEDQDETGKTAYALTVSGKGFTQQLSGTIKRKSAKGGPDIDIQGGQGITEAGKRSGKWGEDLQDRFDIKGEGPFKVSVTNWTGRAAMAITLEVVDAPPPIFYLWIIIAVLCPLAIFVDVRYGTDRLAGDVGLLCFFALFLRDGVTPLDDYQEVVFAIAMAALVGGGAVGGAGTLAEKIWGKHRRPIDMGRGRREAAARAEAKAAKDEPQQAE